MVKMIDIFGPGKAVRNGFKTRYLWQSAEVEKSNSGKVLEVSGARQAGKTYILTKFAKEDYKNFIYIKFRAHFIVTDSYPGKTMQKEYFLPAGDIETMILDTLSYEEFLQAAGKRELYETIDLFGNSSHEDYRSLKELYDIYCRIGGYPAVVQAYFEEGDIGACRKEVGRIIHIFIDESERYFENILEMNLLEQLLPAIAQDMIREKKGSPDLIRELSTVVFRDDSIRVTKKSVNQAIAWFYRSNVIGYCGQVNEGNILDITLNCRFYFRDLGVARYFFDMAGAQPDTISGMINENFVYLYLKKKADDQGIAGLTPLYALYKDGELDFFVNSRKDYQNYGIEVKAGRAAGKTANRMLADGKIQYLYLLKSETYGGVEGKKLTVPVYLAGRIRFGE